MIERHWAPDVWEAPASTRAMRKRLDKIESEEGAPGICTWRSDDGRWAVSMDSDIFWGVMSRCCEAERRLLRWQMLFDAVMPKKQWLARVKELWSDEEDANAVG